jgi:exodeoxyribonuclease V gamma subunit
MGLKGRSPRDLFPVFRASGEIPPGRVGEWFFEEMVKGVEGFLQKAEYALHREPLEALDLDQRIGPFRLVGRIEGLYREEMVRYRYARLKAADFLHAWIRHLILNAVGPAGTPRVSRIIGLHEKRAGECVERRLSPVEDGLPLIETLLERYWSGLVAPLRFFPASSRVYAESIQVRGEEPDAALRRARDRWRGDEYRQERKGERDDPYYRVCFGEEDPLNPAFEEASLGVFGPLLDHLG